MKIKLSKSQWEFVGKRAGWMKTTQSIQSDAKIPSKLLNKLNNFPEDGMGYIKAILVLNNDRRIMDCALSSHDGTILSINDLPVYTKGNLDFDVENIIDIEMIN